MYDSTTPTDIPRDAQAVLGYVDGRYKWSDSDWLRFPDAVKIRIAVFATTDDGDVLDVEAGDATPELAPGWLAKRMVSNPGRRFAIYCNLATIDAVRLHCQGIPFDWWAAHPTGKQHMIDGAVATQWAWPDYGSGGHFDISTTIPGWPKIRRI